MEKNNYDAAVMLSGGKDSCYVSMMLVDMDVKILAITIDNGFMSDVARENIDKLVNILNIDSVIVRPAPSIFNKIIDENLGLIKTCSACSMEVLSAVYKTALRFNIKKVYAGFNKYTAQAQGWSEHGSKMVGDVEFINPLYDKYDLNEIRERILINGLVYDPTVTNCKHIQRLIRESKDNPFIDEANSLLKDRQIGSEEYDKYMEWMKNEESRNNSM